MIAGIVLTGGGAQLNHIKQLVEYITGMDTRIGYPNEHLAGNSDEEISSPLYATAVGLVMNSIENSTQSAVKITFSAPEKVNVYRAPVEQIQEIEVPIQQVLTGGGAQLNHIKQLVEYITGMDTRIGYPNEHLAGDSDEEISSPLYATAVGLVMNSIENNTQSAVRIGFSAPEKVNVYRAPVEQQIQEIEVPIQQVEEEERVPVKIPVGESTETKIRKSFFDKYVDKIKEFLDNAE